jgi:hypothetical protein
VWRIDAGQVFPDDAWKIVVSALAKGDVNGILQSPWVQHIGDVGFYYLSRDANGPDSTIAAIWPGGEISRVGTATMTNPLPEEGGALNQQRSATIAHALGAESAPQEAFLSPATTPCGAITLLLVPANATGGKP